MSTPINISASRGAAILGLSSWKTSVQSWLEIMEARQPGFCKKHGYEMPEFEETAAIRWGNAFESAIIELAERMQDDKIIDREMFLKKYDCITCHIDGKYLMQGCKKGKPDEIIKPIDYNDIDWRKKYSIFLHEGKTTSFYYWKDNFGDPGTDKISVEYQIQTQHQMICTGAEKAILSVLVFPRRVEEWEEMGWMPTQETYNKKNYFLKNNKEYQIIDPKYWAIYLDQMGYFHQYIIAPHPELQQKMIEKYTEFWNENVLKEIPPEPQDYADIKALCPEPIGTILADYKLKCKKCNHEWRSYFRDEICPECNSDKEEITVLENIAGMMSEYKNIKSEISKSGELGKRADQIKVQILDYMRNSGYTEDDESKDKWILRTQDGKKIASYGRNKKGILTFR